MKKQFKIGESCKGGIISVSVNGEDVTIDNKEFFSGKILKTRHFLKSEQSNIQGFLMNLTTPYYSDNIMAYIYKD